MTSSAIETDRPLSVAHTGHQSRPALAAVMASPGSPACHCIGEIVTGRGVRLYSEQGELPVPRGWDHFAT